MWRWLRIRWGGRWTLGDLCENGHRWYVWALDYGEDRWSSCGREGCDERLVERYVGWPPHGEWVVEHTNGGPS